MKLTVFSRINVNGVWWDISTEHAVNSDASPEKKVGRIKGFIKGLHSTGQIISRVAAPPPEPALPKETLNPGGQVEKMPEISAYGSPNCSLHHEVMILSKTQKEEEYAHFYCPKRVDGGYCKHRAKVNRKTKVPNFWEVK